MSSPNGGTVTMSASVTDKLPTTDNDRLFFYAEVVVANIPSLIADLSSPKYTFLSFSEKTRTEVKQKSALIQSISRTFNNVLSMYRQLEEKGGRLERYEVQLVTASPPRFVTSDELLEEKKAGTSGGGGEQAGKEEGGTVMVLSEGDIRPVREAERENAAETDAFRQLSKAADDMEKAFAEARVKCEEMTKHVQALKTKYDELQNSLATTQCERRLLAVVRAEFQERQSLFQEAVGTLQAMEQQCRHEELDIIRQSIAKAEADVDTVRHELLQRKERHEVELAAYQIAWKEAQADVETLKDDIAFLKKHQKDLEVLAMQQQLEESDQNSLKKLVMRSLTWSTSKSGDGKKVLSAEQLADVMEAHPLVSVLAANIFAMDEQRKSVAGVLAQVENAFDNDAVRVALEHIQAILGPAISLDDEALNL